MHFYAVFLTFFVVFDSHFGPWTEQQRGKKGGKREDGCQKGPRRVLGAILDGILGGFGPLGSSFGSHLEPLGPLLGLFLASWEPLGSLLGAFFANLKEFMFFGLLESFCVFLGSFFTCFEALESNGMIWSFETCFPTLL